MTSPPLLEATGLTMWRGERCLFHGLDLAVRRGRALHVRGPNGAGKTTLLRILCGLLAPVDGILRVLGEPVRGADPRLRALVGYLGHADALKLELAVDENLRFAAAIAGVESPAPPAELLERMGIARLAGLETRALSAGQRRRLAIGRLVGGGHRLWVLDEPFTALDRDGVALLASVLDEALARDVGIVFTSHQSAPLDPSRVDAVDIEPPAQ